MSQLSEPISKEKRSLTSRVIETRPTNWREFQFIQQDDFKELPQDARNKLKASIVANQFTQPFYLWEDPDSSIVYCLDGKHRTLLLEELATEGYDVPYLLPGTFMLCKDKKEASKLVLIYSSMYAKITQQGLFDFVQLYKLDMVSMKDVIDLPGFSMDRFEQKFDSFLIKNDQDEYEVEIDPDEPVVVKPGDIFHLDDHRVLCGSFAESGSIATLMGQERARILITDPPYNLPANFFLKDNKTTNNHQNFAMAAGEMSDDEFVAFLAMIMKEAVDHTLPGAIHYIFMDWRHVWHMMEASRKVYGSVIPKQLCVWKKDIMANGSFYRAQQELCFVFSSPGAKNLWNNDMLDNGGGYKNNDELVFIFKNGDAPHLSHIDLVDRIRSNVWNYPSANSMKNPDRLQLKNHPTPKPVAMIADAILDTTNPGDAVIDFFLGSGTTIIAAEKTGRRCYGTEVDPKYVQSIIKRYVLYCTKNQWRIDFKHVNGSLTLNDFNHEKIK